MGTTLKKTIDDVNKSVKSELNLKVGPESNFAKMLEPDEKINSCSSLELKPEKS